VEHRGEGRQHLHLLQNLTEREIPLNTDNTSGNPNPSSPSTRGAQNEQLAALGWLFLEQHQQRLQCHIGVPGTNRTVVQQTLHIVHHNAAERGAIGIVEDLSDVQTLGRLSVADHVLG